MGVLLQARVEIIARGSCLPAVGTIRWVDLAPLCSTAARPSDRPGNGMSLARCGFTAHDGRSTVGRLNVNCRAVLQVTYPKPGGDLTFCCARPWGMSIGITPPTFRVAPTFSGRVSTPTRTVGSLLLNQVWGPGCLWAYSRQACWSWPEVPMGRKTGRRRLVERWGGLSGGDSRRQHDVWLVGFIRVRQRSGWPLGGGWPTGPSPVQPPGHIGQSGETRAIRVISPIFWGRCKFCKIS